MFIANTTKNREVPGHAPHDSFETKKGDNVH